MCNHEDDLCSIVKYKPKQSKLANYIEYCLAATMTLAIIAFVIILLFPKYITCN